MSYEIHLDVFEGPFEVLLTLIAEHRLDVCDVPIATLTEDYLAYLDTMVHMDLDVTTEFLVVAATLLQLKARALLPVPVDEDGGIPDDVDRDVLIARLLEVRTFQGAGALLADGLARGDLLFPPAPAPDDPALRALPTLAQIQAADLARSLVALIVDRAPRPVDTSTLVSQEISMEQAVSEVVRCLSAGISRFRDMCSRRTLSWSIALFLALLEMAMRDEVLLGQGERLGDIEVSLQSRGVVTRNGAPPPPDVMESVQ